VTLDAGAGLELLFERADLPRFMLPEALSRIYGGGLGFAAPRLFANFVTSLDGVVSLAGKGESGHVISQNNEADRFVMGLLRACADAVVVGAGTFRRTPGALWHPGAIHPPSSRLYEDARRSLGLSPQPKLVVVTGSGEIDVTQPAFADAIVATTRAGEARLRGRVPATAGFFVCEGAAIRFADLLADLHARGLRIVLTEGGPSLFAQLVAERVLDELFVTSSPALFGRYAGDGRKSLADGLDLGGAPLELLSARRHRSHLFLRYAFERTSRHRHESSAA
jgi:riboflavin biosynthesis pyrimidine reductase